MATWKSTKEVAQLIGKHEKTVRNWCRWGWVAAKPLPSGKGWLVLIGDDGLPVQRQPAA